MDDQRRQGETQVRVQRSGAVVSLLCLILVTMFAGTCGLNSEGFALLAFKAAVLDDPRQALQDWNPNDTTPCEWNGVRCDANQSVEQVSLPRQRLIGTLVADLRNLTNLRRLNLHDNAFFGPLPSGLLDAPLLRSLYLFSNNLSGIVPANVDQLVSIQHLDISNNGFVGGIPAEITACTNLQTLVMSDNQLSGSIPDGLGNALKDLEFLDLSSNQLDGEIPPDLGNLTSLQGPLNLSNNQLTGPIPESLGNLPVLASLDLSNNTLSGAIPTNGIFPNQSPSAFLNNSGLCGPPLRTACAPSPAPSPAAASPLSPFSPQALVMRKTGLSAKAIIAIVVGDSVGIIVIVIVFVYCIRRRSSCQNSKKSSDSGNIFSDNSTSNSQSWGCFPVSKDGSEASEKVEQGELVRLDSEVKFDLEELLRASAYVLGKSGVGIVYKAILEEGVSVAVRRLGEGGANCFKEFEHEVQLIGKIRHPNIVSLRAYYWAVDEKLLVYDFIPNGSLAAVLHGRTADGSSVLSWAERLRIAQGVARGLAYIHACGGKHRLVHRDIKPSNILLDANMEARISDLGLARLQNLAGGSVVSSAKNSLDTASLSSGSAATSSGGQSGGLGGGGLGRRGLPAADQKISPSSSYYPAEAAEVKKKPTQKWDVYSFGVVLLEMLTGRSPAMHSASDDMDLATWVRETVEERKPISEILDPQLCTEIPKLESEFMEALQIALLCTEPSVEQRPMMSLVSHSLEQIGRKLEICVSE